MIFVQGCPTRTSILAPSFRSNPLFLPQSQPRFHQIYFYQAPPEKQQPKSKMNDETNTKEEYKSSQTQQNKPSSLSIHGHDTELTRNQSGYTLSVDLPGVRPSDLRVQVVREEGVLMINADRTIGGTTKTYSRQFSLDEDTVDTTNISASLVDGVLEISIPKKEKDKAKPMPITVAVKTGYNFPEQMTESLSPPKKELVVMDVPGVKPESVKIELFEHRLNVQAERRKGDTVTKKYHRVFAINPQQVDTTQLEAYLADGVLTVVAPEKEPPAPQTIPVSTAQTKPNEADPKLSEEEFVNVETTVPETVSEEEAAEDEAASSHD